MKKFTALLICLLMVITCGLAGCAGFSINKVKYYNEVLATVGDTHITRYDLLSAYNSYGSNYYVSQQGKSEKEALESTLDLLVDREALYQYASNVENNAKYKPTAYQVNVIVEELFSSLDEQMETYIKNAKKVLNIKTETTIEDEKEEEKAYPYSSYVVNEETKRAFIVDTGKTYYTDATHSTKAPAGTVTDFYSIESEIVYNEKQLKEPTDYTKLLTDDYLNDHTKAGIITKIQDKYFSTNNDNKGRFLQDLEKSEKENAVAIYNKVMQLFAADLMDYEEYLRDENGKEYTKNLSDLVYRYIERNFKSSIQSQYLENVRIEYLKDSETKLSITLLLEKFDKLYTSSYNKYNNREDAYKKAMKDAGTNADDILYHPTLNDATATTENTEFGYFVHTLISFNDTQKALYEAMNKITSEKTKQTLMAEIIRLFSVDPEDVNEEGGNLIYARDSEGKLDKTKGYSLQQVLDDYNTIKDNPAYDDEARLNAFVKEFMFKYTGDTATLSAGMPYVVGTNGNSAMEQAFTDECVKLMKTGDICAMSQVSLADTNSLCITSYGIHIVMYVGEVDANDYPITDTSTAYIHEFNNDNDKNGIYNLYEKVLNPLTGATYFDMLFDAVYPQSGDAEVFASENGYSDYEEGLISTAKELAGVKYYKTNIKGTKTSL